MSRMGRRVCLSARMRDGEGQRCDGQTGNAPFDNKDKSGDVWRIQREQSLGFAHLFRPRYAGANLGHPSVLRHG